MLELARLSDTVFQPLAVALGSSQGFSAVIPWTLWPGQFFDVSLGSLSLLPSEASVLALASCLPFSLQLSIRCGADRFKVYANGQHLFDFSHRLSAFQRVDLVEIHGDITLSYVQI